MSMYAVLFKGLKNPIVVRAEGSHKAINKAKSKIKGNRLLLSIKKLSGVEMKLLMR